MTVSFLFPPPIALSLSLHLAAFLFYCALFLPSTHTLLSPSQSSCLRIHFPLFIFLPIVGSLLPPPLDKKNANSKPILLLLLQSVSSAETARLKRRTRIVVNDENEDPIVVSHALVFDGFKDVPATLPPKRRPADETPALLSPIKQQLPRSRTAAAAATTVTAITPSNTVAVTAAPRTIRGMQRKQQQKNRPLSTFVF